MCTPRSRKAGSRLPSKVDLICAPTCTHQRDPNCVLEDAQVARATQLWKRHFILYQRPARTTVKRKDFPLFLKQGVLCSSGWRSSWLSRSRARITGVHATPGWKLLKGVSVCVTTSNPWQSTWAPGTLPFWPSAVWPVHSHAALCLPVSGQ